MKKVSLRAFVCSCLILFCAAASFADAPTLKPFFTWKDSRPIGIWHLSDPTYIRANNPSGWNSADDALSRWPNTYLDAALPVLKSIDAQAVIIWDIEGSAKGLELQYLGDPTLAPAMNPGMDYDAFFARLRKQKIIPGVCLRPTNIVDGKHVSDPDPYANLARKISFARGLWKCRLFYIDSNVRDAGQMPDVPNAWVEGPLIPATVFARLHQKFPDCLLIPEHKDPNYHLWTVPYREALVGQLGTPGYILNDIPQARSALNLNTLTPDQIKSNWPALKSSNCIFLMNAWWQDDPNLQTYIECSRR